jgi:hypothetical protein
MTLMRIRIRIQLYTLMQIRIRTQLLFKMICLRPIVYTVRQSKAFEFDFNADPNPAFHSNADPYTASKKCGSGYETLPKTHIKITLTSNPEA